MEKITPIDFRDKDVLDFFRAFLNHNINYLLVGAFAMAFHGYIRATRDLDLWIQDRPATVQRFKQAFVGDPGFKAEPLKCLKTLKEMTLMIVSVGQ